MATVDDRPIANQPAQVVGAQFEVPVQEEGPSIHNQLCSWLVFRGTRDAVPGLLTVIEENRILAPSDTTYYRYDRYAALAIAQRDPWPDVDRWLGKVLASSDVLLTGQTDGPELGATAAAILLRRNGGNVNDFPLIQTGDAFARRCGLEAYRYRAADAPEKVADWWNKRQEELNSQNAATESDREVHE